MRSAATLQARCADRQQRVAQSLVGDRLDRLRAECFHQKALRLMTRNAARHEIEQLVLVELADSRAMSADDIVRENLELRLVVHRRAFGQHERVALHAAVGLLRMGTHDDLALIDAGRIVFENVPEEFAARAMRHGMIDDERRVGQPRAIEQREARKRDGGMLPDHARENLAAHETAIGDKAERVEVAVLLPASTTSECRWIEASPAKFTRAICWALAPAPSDDDESVVRLRRACRAGSRNPRRA